MLEKFLLKMDDEDDESTGKRKKQTNDTKKSAMISFMFLNLKAALETRTGMKWTWRKLENYICKLFRIDTGGCEVDTTLTTTKKKKKNNVKKMYFDIMFYEQNLYSLEEKGVNVELPDGTNKFYEGGLVPTLLWRGNVVSFDDFIKKKG